MVLLYCVNKYVGKCFDYVEIYNYNYRNFTPEQLEQIIKAKTFTGSRGLELSMVDLISMSDDYFENFVKEKYSLWICSKEKTSKSIISSLLNNRIKFLGTHIQSILSTNLPLNKTTIKQQPIDKNFTGINFNYFNYFY